MQNIRRNSEENVWITVPPRPERQRMAAYIAEVAGQIEMMEAANEKTIFHLRERRSALIAAAVTGQLSVEG